MYILRRISVAALTVLIACSTSACGEDDGSSFDAGAADASRETTLRLGQKPHGDVPLRSPLRPEELAAVGAVAGRRGLCTGTIVAPSWVLTTKSCLLAATSDGKPMPERLAELNFVTPNDHDTFREPIGVRAVRTDTAAALQSLIYDATHKGWVWRPTDELVVLELDEPIVGVAPLPVTHNTSIALYNQPRLVTVRHSAEGATARQPVGPRSQRGETVFENADHALFGNEETVARPDFGAPLLACEGGRWVVLGALSSSDYRDEDGGRTSQTKWLSVSQRARYLRVDITTALWQFHRRTGQIFELQAIQPTAEDAPEVPNQTTPPENINLVEAAGTE